MKSLVTKPEGMCTIGTNGKSREVILGFHTEEQAQTYRDAVVDIVIAETMGGKEREKQKEYKLFGDIDEEKLDPEFVACLRKEFEHRYRSLSLIMELDAWDRPQYAHSHVQCLWKGYLAGCMSMKPPTGYKVALELNTKFSEGSCNAASAKEVEQWMRKFI